MRRRTWRATTAVIVVERGERPVGGRGDRRVDTARGAVRLERQRAAVTAQPRLAERVAEQRQRPGRMAELAHDHVGETGFDVEAAAPRRFLDRTNKVGFVHRSEQDLAVGEALPRGRQARRARRRGRRER